MFVMLSELPEYNDKIRVGHAMTPAAILKYNHPLAVPFSMNFLHTLAVSTNIHFTHCAGIKLIF